MNNTEDIFAAKGGRFLLPFSQIRQKLKQVKGFVFDWDGVFNDGYKRDMHGSPFSEPDSMGINMMRFSTYLAYGYVPPLIILTGENNESAIHLSKRESFTAVYGQVKNKSLALDHIREHFSLSPDQLAYIYDDILDLTVAKDARLRFLVLNKSNPMFNSKVVKEGWADYITYSEGGCHAVREVCELIIGLNENYDDVIDHRMTYSESYHEYLETRNKVTTEFYNGGFGEIKPWGPQDIN